MNTPIDIDALNARTGMNFRASRKDDGNPWVRAAYGPVFLFLSDKGLMVALGEPTHITVYVNEGDVESSMPWLLDMGRTMARVRELLAEMMAAVGG